METEVTTEVAKRGRPVKYPKDKIHTMQMHLPIECEHIRAELNISWAHIIEAGIKHIVEKLNTIKIDEDRIPL